MARRPRKRPLPRKRSYHTGSIARRGKRWRIRWRAGGRQHTESHATRELAELALLGKLGDLARGKAAVPVRRKVSTLAALVPDLLDRRDKTHRNTPTERGRWENHIEPTIGHLRPDEVTPAVLRRLIEDKLAGGKLDRKGKKTDDALSSTTVRNLIALVSTIYTDLVERGEAAANPVSRLPRATRRLIRVAHDPTTTPFVEQLADIRRIFLALPEPYSIAYTIGAMAGLRTGEVRALRWVHVDLDRGRIHVRESTDGPLKDDDSRIVPIQNPLVVLLKSWKLRAGPSELVVNGRKTSRTRFLGEHLMGEKLRETLTSLGLPRLTWYQATRHTFASQWVLADGTIEKLRVVLGHSSVAITERYAHLRPDHFTEQDTSRVVVDLSPATGAVVSLR